MKPEDFPLQRGDLHLTLARYVKNLGAWQDSTLTMERHVNNITRSCYHHIRNIGKIRNNITTDACRTLVQATITSRLDYANALLYGLPKSLISRLQRVQHSAARLISRTKKHDHITPVMIELDWLPVESRVKYKVLLYVYKVVHGSAPSYLQDMLSVCRPTRALRSASQSLLSVPKARTVTYGDRSFRVAAPTLWNMLPDYLKNAPTERMFKKQLKTHLFKLAYHF